VKDASQYPNLITELITLGCSAPDRRNMYGEKLLRVWSPAERAAADPSMR
jgi:microsomal dipeptidase-like Zn-dependent dipeptidase